MNDNEKNDKNPVEEFLGTGDVPEDDYDDFSDMDKTPDEFVNRKSTPVFSRILLLVLVIGASGFGLWLLKSDMLYYLSSRTPVRMGYAENIDIDKAPPSGTLVDIRGTRQLQRLELKYASKANSFFSFFGTNKVFVLSPSAYVEEQLETFGLRSDVEYIGRLMRLGELSSFPQIHAWYKEKKGKDISPQALVVLERQFPQDYWWAMTAFVVLALSLLFSCYRLFRLFTGLKKK